MWSDHWAITLKWPVPSNYLLWPRTNCSRSTPSCNVPENVWTRSILYCDATCDGSSNDQRPQIRCRITHEWWKACTMLIADSLSQLSYEWKLRIAPTHLKTNNVIPVISQLFQPLRSLKLTPFLLSNKNNLKISSSSRTMRIGNHRSNNENTLRRMPNFSLRSFARAYFEFQVDRIREYIDSKRARHARKLRIIRLTFL